MIVHADGIVVHAIDQPHLAPLARLLIGRGYGLGERREILAHALAFDSIEGVVREDLLRPEDLADAEQALDDGRGEVPFDDPAWGAPEGQENPFRLADDCWSHQADPAIVAAEPEPCKCHADRAPAGRPLDAILQAEADRHRRAGTPIGGFLADQLQRMADVARFCGATTPEQYNDRVEVLEMEARATYYDRGYADGAAGARSFVA